MSQICQINGVRTSIEKDSGSASDVVAGMIADQVRRRPDGVLGLATGGTPVQAYRRLVQMNARGDVDFSQITSFNLDEYIGLDGNHPQSFRSFMEENLFEHINIDKQRTHVPDGVCADVVACCEQYEDSIRKSGGIDLQLLGLGHNGHIAFNEPGSPVTSRTRQVDLTAETIESNSRFFDSIEEVPRHAITMGIATILDARRIVLLATGEGKSDAVSGMLVGPVGESMPASLLRNHPDVIVVLDQPAASKLDLASFPPASA